MPNLNWIGKQLREPAPAPLRLDSIIYPQGHGYPNARPENRLFQGDNFAIMSALMPEYEGRVNLIYADPPFFTNRKFSARIGRGEDSRKPQDWQLTDGYHDHWEGLDDYLQFLYERLALMTRGVIDKNLRVFGYRNMLVCDGSVMPANPGVNPSLTITALAEHAMSQIPSA